MATYDIDALKADLPTAKELAQFVYYKTGLSLELVGKPKEDQYQVAKNALEGKKVPSEFLTDENPYVEKKDVVPEDPMPQVPAREAGLPDPQAMVHHFGATNMPHPLDPQSDRKVHITFRKYEDGSLTFEVMGPLEKQAVGSRLNKYGQVQPEKYTWLDPRTGEKLMRKADGTFTKEGRGMYAYCVGEKGGGIWNLIDKEAVRISEKNIANPWA